MPNILPNVPPMRAAQKRKPHSPPFIMQDGREYLSASTINERLGRAEYHPADLKKARDEGLPHIGLPFGNRFYYYYNWDDFLQWHQGESA